MPVTCVPTLCLSFFLDGGIYVSIERNFAIAFGKLVHRNVCRREFIEGWSAKDHLECLLDEEKTCAAGEAIIVREVSTNSEGSGTEDRHRHTQRKRGD